MAYKDPEKAKASRKAYLKAYRQENKEKKKAYDKAYREANKEKRKAYQKAYRQENKEKKKAYQKVYWQKNKEKLKAINKSYREANKEKRKAYIEANREKIRAQTKVYGRERREITRVQERNRRKTDHTFRLTKNLRCRVNLALKGKCKSKSTMELIGCTIDEFWLHLEKQFQSGMTRENYGFGEVCWHVDHIKPCASFDLSDPEQQKICFHYTNCQPLWQRDNLSKGAKFDG